MTNEVIERRLDPARDEYGRLSAPQGRDAVQVLARARLQRVRTWRREQDPWRVRWRTPRAARRFRAPASSRPAPRTRTRTARNSSGPSWSAGQGRSDVTFEASLSDVRNKTGLTDYVGELQGRFTVRASPIRSNGAVAHRGRNGPGGPPPVLHARHARPRAGAASVGSTCAVSTSANAVTPGLVQAGKRAVWEMSQIQVLDGGPDGDVDTPSGNTVFARQGVFIP